MAGYFCFCMVQRKYFSVNRLVSIWVCVETDVNQTLCDTRGRGRVGNEMEDVIKGKRGGLSESIQLLGSVRMDSDRTHNFSR